jgi:hypothetical protein
VKQKKENETMKYKTFDDWFDELEGFAFRSERFFSDAQCPDPFHKNGILREWMKTSWELGKQSYEIEA